MNLKVMSCSPKQQVNNKQNVSFQAYIPENPEVLKRLEILKPTYYMYKLGDDDAKTMLVEKGRLTKKQLKNLSKQFPNLYITSDDYFGELSASKDRITSIKKLAEKAEKLTMERVNKVISDYKIEILKRPTDLFQAKIAAAVELKIHG